MLKLDAQVTSYKNHFLFQRENILTIVQSWQKKLENELIFLKQIPHIMSQCSLRAKQFNLVLRTKFNLFLVLLHEGDLKQVYVKSYHSALVRYWWLLQLEILFSCLVTFFC